MAPKDEQLYHRVAIVIEVDDYQTGPYHLSAWAHDRSYELVSDLHRRGVEAFALSVLMDRDLSRGGPPVEERPGPERSQKTP